MTMGLTKFFVHEQVGEGTFSQVYRATMHTTYLDGMQAQSVACKGVKNGGVFAYSYEENIATLRNDIAILSQLYHPNILRSFGGHMMNGRLFHVMEFFPGKGISAVDEAKENIAVTVHLAKQLFSALHYLGGIIHRDLQYENVRVLANLTLKVTDFGLSGQSDEEKADVGCRFMHAPEVLMGVEDTPRRDMFAAGLIVYRLFVGEYLLNIAEEEQHAVMEQIEKALGSMPFPKALDHYPEFALRTFYNIDTGKLYTSAQVDDGNNLQRVSHVGLQTVLQNTLTWFPRERMQLGDALERLYAIEV